MQLTHVVWGVTFFVRLVCGNKKDVHFDEDTCVPNVYKNKYKAIYAHCT